MERATDVEADMTRFIALTLLFGSLIMGQTMQDFTRIYDKYVAAVRKGSFGEVSALFSQEMKKELDSKEDQERFMTFAKFMAPASYEPQFLTLLDGGQKAELQVVATLNVPEDIQKERNLPPTQRLELTLNFVKEGGQWKWDMPTIHGDPDKRARPKDLKMGSRSEYKEGSNMEMGGQILRLEKQASGTVYVIRVLDEEIAVFIPAAIVSGEFVPGSVLQVHGAENKSDKLKFWADEAALLKR
jgi:hypothetical protein